MRHMSVAVASSSPRMDRLLDAALTVVADGGIRGLTHRAVDREAGLPEGSCSAYLRTRSALQIALAGHVADRLAADVARLRERMAGCEDDQAVAVAETTRLFVTWLDEPRLWMARQELTMEGLRDPAVAARLTVYRDQLTDVVVESLRSAGELHDRPRAATLIAALDGIVTNGLQQPRRHRRAFVEQCVSILLPALIAEADPASETDPAPPAEEG